MMTLSLFRNLLASLAFSTAAANGQILDNFDNGSLNSNTTGTGSGFSSYGTAGVSENSGFAQMNSSGGYATMVITSNDVVSPFGVGLSTAVFRFGSISVDSGWHRFWVGYRQSDSTTNHFFPYERQVQGLYVSVISGDGYNLRRGNLVAVNESGSQTVLASWNWADQFQLSNLVVTLRTTATNYELVFSGAAGGTPAFVSGAATGTITGLGTAGNSTFRMGVHNQYAGSSGGVRVDALEFSNVPQPEIAVELDPATPLVDGGNVSFGVASAGPSVSRTFTIRNTGNADLTDLAISMGGPDAGEFTVTTAPTAPVTGSGGSTTFTVAFTPADSGSKLATLQIANNDSDENPFEISLIGGPEAEINLAQPANTPLVDGSTPMSFPPTALGKTSDLVFHVANSGSGPLTPLAITFDGANAADFSISSAPSVPVGVSDSTTFTVRFTPSGSGAKTATLHLASNDVDESPFDIDLRGQAYGPGDVITLASLSSNSGPRYPRGDLTLGLDGDFYGMSSSGGSSGQGIIFKMAPGGTLTTLVNFDSSNGAYPVGSLIQATDGNFYGMTESGGNSGRGTAFKMTPAGALTTLVHFDYYSSGASPKGNLTQGIDGNFYGMTYYGGPSGYGTIFKLTPEGVLTTLVGFNYQNGYYPCGSLTLGSDGNFYGMTTGGGTSGAGTVFTMTPTGVLTTLVNFSYSGGANPYGSLIQASDGNFYGMTQSGGTSGYGTAFKMTPAGVLTTLVNFDYYTNGYGPQGSLMQGSDGNFYGMTQGGGSSGNGTIFKMTPGGAAETLVNFNGTNGGYPYGSLIQSSDGLLYGMTYQGGSSGMGTIFGIALPAEISVEVDTAIAVRDGGNVRYGEVASGTTVSKTFMIRNQGGFDLTDLTITKSGPDAADFSVTSSPTAPLSGPNGSTTFTVDFSPADSALRRATLHIANNDADESPYDIVLSGGLEPEINVEQPAYSPLVDGSAERIFPLTQQGRSHEMVFHVSNTGVATLTPLDITIDGANASDFSVVASPATSLGVSDSTTFTVRFTPSTGGARTATLHLVSNDVDENPFDITLRGQAYGPGDIIPLVSLTSSSGPHYPQGDLTLGLDGNFYGMASNGGTAGQGVIFKLAPGGLITTLINFDSSNGSYPSGNLIQATDGNFYGMTRSGGSSGSGTAFKMTPAGVLTTLVNFDYYSNGSGPNGSLIQGSDGNFYGMTENGGPSGSGAIFQMTPEGVLTTLVNFNHSNGANPRGSLILSDDGNFYGLTVNGGNSGYGTAFKMTPQGTLTTLVNFNYSSGRNPYGSLIQGSDGNFYGMTQSGGNSDYGTAFKMTPAGVITTLVSFNYSNGRNPQGSLMQGNDGNFYGMTQSGGNSGGGTVFKMTPAGVIETMVHFNGTNGSNPYGSLIQGGDGLLYGMTYQGGSTGVGTIFGLALYPEIAIEVDSAVPVSDGGDVRYGVVATGSTVSKTFTIRNKGGFDLTNLAITKSGPDEADFTVTSTPSAPVASNGATTFTVAFTPSASGFKQVSLRIASNDADENPFDIKLSGGPEPEIIVEQPVGTTLMDGSTTRAYPITEVGSASNLVFHVTNSGSGPLTPMNITIDGDHASDFSVVASPSASVGVSGSTTFTVRFMPSGSGLRTASLHLATNDLDESPFDINLRGQAYGVGEIIPIVTLGDNTGGPRRPRGDLTLGLDGNFYGMSSYGGTNDQGSVFRMTPAGIISTLVSFDYSTTGYSPAGSLIQSTDGNFYGMTISGGPSDYGTAFKMTPEGALTVLVNFNSSNGGSPYGNFIQGSDGNFYGLTSQGGSSSYGTAFQMTPEGTLTTLVNFDYSNGGYPYGSLIQGSDGDFYGTTAYGGPNGNGTIFKMTLDGELTTLVSFDNSNGYSPKGSLMQASDGNFYGMTESGGDYGNGTTFRMTPDGTLTTLVSFDYSNGYYPQGSLMQASDGHLYGMAQYGGSNGHGVVFRLTLEGILTVLDSFDYYTDGYSPYGGLTQGNDGLLYGMTYEGGPNYAGTIFGLSIGAGPLTPGVPEVLAVTPPKGLTFGGTNVRITGRDFTDATSVTFGGLPATNVVVLNRATITCTTPAHVAGPASVLVTTPLGTNPANSHFTYNEPPEIDVEQQAGIPQPSGSSLDFGSETAAPSENALKFDGQNDNVSVPTYSGINFTTKYTAETWMNVSSYQYGTLISKFEDDGDNRGWMINMGETGDTTKIYVTQSASGAWVNPIQWNTGFSPALNTWYHIAVVFDSSLGSNQLKLYVNGSLYSQTSWYSTMVANNANLYFGGYDGWGNGLNGGADSRFFNGALDDVRLWNVARTASEIQNAYNQILVGTETGLVGHWKLNQGVAGGANAGVTTVLATTGSNGTLVNSALSGTSSNWISRIATNLAGVVTKTFTVFNTGAGPLDITGLSVAGGNVTDFTVNTSGMLTTVPAGGSTTFSVAFSPSAPGTRQTTLTLLNDDLDESSYSFVLTGYGIGPDDPAITGITPSSGTTLGGTVITITGTKFTGTTGVTLGGAAAAFTVNSDSQITCTTPAGSLGAASLRVTTSVGTNPPNTLFTYVAPNNPPTFSGFSASTPYQTAATISTGKLLAKAADADADALAVTSAGPASTQGGTVILQSGSIRYTPANGYSGADTFPITITDARGASVSGTVTVTVQLNTGIGTNAAVLTTMPEGRMGLGFHGIPGRSYQIQRTTDLETWIPLGSVTAAANGAVIFVDESPPPGSAFYRLRKP